jgi:DNA-directed RNA polymerase beta subunit
MIVSVNLNTTPFLSSTDSTRASMSAKQIQQALTSPNTEIPYVIGSDYYAVTNSSKMGIVLAKDDGKVLYKNKDLLIVQYSNLNKIVDIQLPPIKKTTGSFGTKLRYVLPSDSKFKKGDVLANYDCFINNVPSYGYNVFTAYMPFFGFNHEDAITISESLADKARYSQIEKIYIPIYEYTLMQEFYNDCENSYTYFPGVGQKIKDDVVCCLIAPKDSATANYSDLKNRVQMALKNMSLSDLLNMGFAGNNKFAIDKIKTKVENATVSGIKIHRFKQTNTQVMIDQKLEAMLDHLYFKYVKFITTLHHDLGTQFNTTYVEYILKKYYLYINKAKGMRGEISLNNLCYLIELEVSKECPTVIGDKLANRYANKGIVSLILPNELRPIALNTKMPIDLIFNPFSVFSRQNLGQLLEAVVGKSTMYCDKHIKENPESVKETISWLNESILKHIDEMYYLRVKNEIIENLDNKEFRDNFIENVNQSNLFVEAPSFAEIDIKTLLKTSIDYKEPVLIKQETIKFIKQKLKLETSFPDSDVYLENILCAPIYIQKLSKLVSKIINARDFGSVKTITKQPTKGRARGGGSRVGQMEIESMLAHGCDLAVKEILSVKSDWTAGKKDLIRQLIVDGKYDLPENRPIKSRTKEVVDQQLKFLKD